MAETKSQRPARDKCRELITERQYAYKYTNKQMAEFIGVSESTYQRMLRAGTRTWKVGQLLDMCHRLKIDKDEVRASI